jgi:hypothetical protein
VVPLGRRLSLVTGLSTPDCFEFPRRPTRRHFHSSWCRAQPGMGVWSQNGHRVGDRGCHGLARDGMTGSVKARSQIRNGTSVDIIGGRGTAGAELQNRCGAVVPSWVGSTPMHSRQIQNLGNEGAGREICDVIIVKTGEHLPLICRR